MACADAPLPRAVLLGLSLAAGLAQAQVFAPATAPLPAAAAPVAPAPSLPAGRWTTAQVQQSFVLADANSDGQLSRAEAQRLAILPRPFEEMDADKDGSLAREEYEGAALNP